MLPQALPRQLQAPAICLEGRSRLPFQPSIFKGVQGCRLPAPKCFRRPCQGNSRSYRPQPSVFKGVQGCRNLPAPKCSRLPLARPQMLPQATSQLHAPAIWRSCPPPNAPAGNSRSYRPQPSVFKGVQGCRCPPPNASAGRQGNSRSYRPQPSVLKGVQGCGLRAPKCFRSPCQGNSRSYRPQPSVFKGVQGCRLPAPKCFCQGNSRSF